MFYLVKTIGSLRIRETTHDGTTSFSTKLQGTRLVYAIYLHPTCLIMLSLSPLTACNPLPCSSTTSSSSTVFYKWADPVITLSSVNFPVLLNCPLLTPLIKSCTLCKSHGFLGNLDINDFKFRWYLLRNVSANLRPQSSFCIAYIQIGAAIIEKISSRCWINFNNLAVGIDW